MVVPLEGCLDVPEVSAAVRERGSSMGRSGEVATARRAHVEIWYA